MVTTEVQDFHHIVTLTAVQEFQAVITSFKLNKFSIQRGDLPPLLLDQTVVQQLHDQTMSHRQRSAATLSRAAIISRIRRTRKIASRSFVTRESSFFKEPTTALSRLTPCSNSRRNDHASASTALLSISNISNNTHTSKAAKRQIIDTHRPTRGRPCAAA